MGNKIIVSTGALFHLPLELIFKVAAQAGFDGIELVIDDNPLTTDGAAINQLVKQFEMPVLSVHMPMSGSSVFGDLPETIISRSFTLAQAIAAKGLVIHPDRKGNDHYEQVIISIMKKYSGHSSITLLLENVPRRDNTRIEKRKQLYNPKFVAHLYQPICLDTSHLATSRLDFRSAVQEVLSFVGHVHLSDSNIIEQDDGTIMDQHLPIGSGCLPLEWVIRRLKASHYSGNYCFELRPTLFEGKSAADVEQFIHRMLVYLRRVLGE